MHVQNDHIVCLYMHVYTILPVSITSIKSLTFPMECPQEIVCKANEHKRMSYILLVTLYSVQETMVRSVVIGHIPQFMAMILYWISEHSGATGFQVKVNWCSFTFIKRIPVGGG